MGVSEYGVLVMLGARRLTAKRVSAAKEEKEEKEGHPGKLELLVGGAPPSPSRAEKWRRRRLARERRLGTWNLGNNIRLYQTLAWYRQEISLHLTSSISLGNPGNSILG